MTPKRVHRRLVDALSGQVAVLGVALQQALALQIAAHTLCDALCQFAEFGAGGRFHPAKANPAGVFDVYAIEKQHVKAHYGRSL